jgi:disulfide oxidoreductase YuzD
VVAHDEKSIVSGPPSAFHDDSIPEEEEEEELVVVDDRAVATGDFEEEEEEQQQQVVVEEEEQVVVVEEEVLRRKRQCQHEEEEDAPPIPKVTTGTSSCGINCSLMVASSLQIDSSAGPGCSAGTSLNQQHLNEKSSFDNQCNATLYNNNNYSQHAAAGDHHHNQQHDQREQQHEEYIDNHQDDEYDKPTITTRFSDIIGHGAAKLRLDEMLIPLALPRCLADRILTGKY